MGFLLGFLIFNSIFSFLFALYVYKNSKRFYAPCTYTGEDGKVIDLHKVYEVFHVHDSLNFFELWIGAFLFFPIKFPLCFFVATTMKFHLQIIDYLYPKSDTDPKQWKKMGRAISFWSHAFLITNGIFIKNRPLDKEKVEKVYKKYLGEDYDFSDEKYSLLISNHTGFFEIVTMMALFSAGFISKKEIADYYWVGPIATAMHCLYVDRESEEARKLIFQQLAERQKKFYDEKFLAPLSIFPEGTTTCGRHILKFKRGAFYSLLPIKPLIININQDERYQLTVGGASVVTAYIKNFCHSYAYLYYSYMPVIRATDFMFKNYGHLSNEKWEVYAEVTKKIYLEIGGFESSLMGLRDSKRYWRAMLGKYDPNENMDFNSSSSNVVKDLGKNKAKTD